MGAGRSPQAPGSHLDAGPGHSAFRRLGRDRRGQWANGKGPRATAWRSQEIFTRQDQLPSQMGGRQQGGLEWFQLMGGDVHKTPHFLSHTSLPPAPLCCQHCPLLHSLLPPPSPLSPLPLLSARWPSMPQASVYPQNKRPQESNMLAAAGDLGTR